MKGSIRWGIGCLLLVFVLSGCQVQKSSGTDIIANILNANNEGVSYYLESKYNDGGEENFISKEWRFADGRLRMEMYENDVLQTMAVFDGKELVFADYTEEEMIVFDSEEVPDLLSQSPRDQTIKMLESMYDYYDIEVAKETKLLDREVFVLELSSKNSEMDRMTIWVDKQNWIMLKTAIEFAGDVIVNEPLHFEVDPEIDERLFIIEGREQFKTVSMDH